jgi:hypothetical protein
VSLESFLTAELQRLKEEHARYQHALKCIQLACEYALAPLNREAILNLVTKALGEAKA